MSVQLCMVARGVDTMVLWGGEPPARLSSLPLLEGGTKPTATRGSCGQWELVPKTTYKYLGPISDPLNSGSFFRETS